LTVAKTATCGSKLVAEPTVVKPIIRQQNILQYMEIPVHKESWMLGDSEFIIKQDIMLSFHHIHEANTLRMIVLPHVPGAINSPQVLGL
jgi:hypothetical protein